MSVWTSNSRLPFGKHRGSTLVEVSVVDPPYLVFLLNEDIKVRGRDVYLEPKDEALIRSLSAIQPPPLANLYYLLRGSKSELYTELLKNRGYLERATGLSLAPVWLELYYSYIVETARQLVREEGRCHSCGMRIINSREYIKLHKNCWERYVSRSRN